MEPNGSGSVSVDNQSGKMVCHAPSQSPATCSPSRRCQKEDTGFASGAGHWRGAAGTQPAAFIEAGLDFDELLQRLQEAEGKPPKEQ
ncbi:hypothetical protein DEA98_25365 [Brucella pseudogrignonensis]|nr:hypothetical protein [Brucella pseudogrignonensis]